MSRPALLKPVATDPHNMAIEANLRELAELDARAAAVRAELAVNLERQRAEYRARVARLSAGPEYLTADDCARVLSVSSEMIRQLMARGALERVYVGTRPLVPRESFERFLAELPSEPMERE